MIRRLFCSMIVMTVAIGFVAADEFTATITKVDGDSVTYQKYKKGEKGKKGEKDGDEVKVSAKGAKINKAGKFNKDDKKFEVGDEVKDGLKNEIFAKIGDNGIGARITTEGDKVTQILVFTPKKKKAAN